MAREWPRDVLDRRIEERFAAQLAEGFVDEVRGLLAGPRGLSRSAGQALGYKELAMHVEDGVPLDETVEVAVQRTRRFSRRQEKWFRRDPRMHRLDAAGRTPDDLARELEALTQRA